MDRTCAAIRRQIVVNDFFPEAEDMRAALEASLKDDRRAKWEYFCDPGFSMMLRGEALQMFPEALFERFMSHFRSWCMDHMGLRAAHASSVNMMINGCTLGLHSDDFYGSWSYVYSLTRWDHRRFSGGETILFNDGVPSYRGRGVRGELIHESIPACFNQLLMFDDRIVHGVATVTGSNALCDGRVVLAGHLWATSPVVVGALDPRVARASIVEGLQALEPRLETGDEVQGLLTYRLHVNANGTVRSAETLTDNLVIPATGHAPSARIDAARAALSEALEALRFPPAAGDSTITLPVLLPLPDLSPIRCRVDHDWSSEELGSRVASSAEKAAGLHLRLSRSRDHFDVSSPLAGAIDVEPHQLIVELEAPMWWPSKRRQYESTLSKWARAVTSRQ